MLINVCVRAKGGFDTSQGAMEELSYNSKRGAGQGI